MEEEKAAAYYDELTRKGEGAARFKQGLGFSSDAGGGSAAPPARGSAFVSSSSSSFLSNFVRASSPTKAAKFEKQAQLESIQNKLKKKPERDSDGDRRREGKVSDRRHRSRSRERDRDRDRERHSRKRSRSRERYRERERDRDRRRRSRSRSRSSSPRRSGKRRSGSPRDRRRSEKDRNSGGKFTDYSKLIDGYDRMTPAEKVKAKMKLQLAETAEKDEASGMGSGWERFEFDTDAPLEDEEIEAAEDDATVVKHIGQSFRFTAIEARRDEQIKVAHDEAMFGSSARAPTDAEDSEVEVENSSNKSIASNHPGKSLLSDKVLASQQGSWRDRARKT